MYPPVRPFLPSQPLPVVDQPLHVLIVEDDRDNADMTACLLELDGHRVEHAAHGRAALRAVRKCPPDVMLIDLAMPGMDGFEVARRVRALELRKRPFLVAVTGHGLPVHRQRSHEAGMDLHLLKPVAASVLQTLLLSFKAKLDPLAP